MMRRQFGATILLLCFIFSLAAPLFAFNVQASNAILLSVDKSHEQLEPGNSTNITLTIANNGSVIDDYNLSIDSSSLDDVWQVNLTQSNVTNVVPTTSTSTTIVIRLSNSASSVNSSSFILNVEETDTGDSSSIEIFVSVLPSYLPEIRHQSPDTSFKNMSSGTTQTFTLDVMNLGSVEDSILLDIGQEPDLSGWWANYSTNTTGNSSGNGSGNASSVTMPSPSGRSYTSPPYPIPAGWSLHFDTDFLSNMSSLATREVNLTITVPSDATPEFYGFRMYAGSLNGNISTSTLIVVEVDEHPDVVPEFLRHDDDFFAGQTTSTSIQVTNTGNVQLNMTWYFDHIGDGPCDASLPNQQTNGFAAADVINVTVNVTVDQDASKDDSCEFMFYGNRIGGGYFLSPVYFDIEIDEFVHFSLVSPSQAIEVLPGTSETFDLRLYNNGSDAADYYLDFSDIEGVTNTVISSSSSTSQPRQLSIEPGSFGVWQVSIDADASISGEVQQLFEVTYGGQTSQAMVDLDILEVPLLTMNGPSENRILISPGTNSSVIFELENIGSQDLILDASISGLPSGLNSAFSFGDNPFELPVDASDEIGLNLVAAPSTNPGTYSVTVTLSHGAFSVSQTLDLIVEQRYGVQVSSLDSSVSPSPLYTVNVTVEVTNVGTISDTYLIELDTSASSAYYSTTLSRTTVTISPGSTQLVTIGVREGNNGAPASNINLEIYATSTTDTSVADQHVLMIEPLSVSSELVIYNDNDVVAPGGSIYGSVILTNSGTSTDALYITTVGIDCGLGQTVELGPGGTSSPLQWACDVPQSSSAGSQELTFRVTSAARSNVVMEQSTIYTVLPTWSSEKAVSISIDDEFITMPFEGGSSFIARLTNDANADAVGSVELYGEGEANFEVSWLRLSDNSATNEFSLQQGQSIEFKVTLNSLVSNSAKANLQLRATSEISSIVVQDESSVIEVNIQGPDLPPNGLSLPLDIDVTQSQAIAFSSAGWMIALLLFLLLRRKSNSILEARDDDDIIDDVDDDVKDDVLGFNECRIGDDNKVRCPSCDTKLGVPRNSTPPFKFTCPKCDSMIRVVGPPSQKF